MALSLDDIAAIYRTAGTARYGAEAINQEQHALQCAQLAAQAGSPPALVAAALLHDLGHLVAPKRQPAVGRNDRHEFVAMAHLRGVFPEAVLEPIRLHVDAKRFLCATEPSYWGKLSPASQRSLTLQGGLFSAAQMHDFMARPHASGALALRRWDDAAKDPAAITPAWEHFTGVLAQVVLAPPH